MLAIYAEDLTTYHLGCDITLVIAGVSTGGILDKVTHTGLEMVDVVIDGTSFIIPEYWPVTVEDNLRHRILTEPELDTRRQLINELIAA